MFPSVKAWPAWLLLLAGTCSGLQYPLQYQYRYRARVTADIPEINDKQKVMSTVKANLRVYVPTPSSVTFQLEDVKFLTCNKCSGSAATNSSEGRKAPQFKAATEEPGTYVGRYSFGIDENGHFVHHADEKEWVVNFYKSIAGLFNISPLRHTFFRTYNETHEGGYVEVEETVLGTCQSTYTSHRLQGVQLAHYQQHLHNNVTQDIQLSDECEDGEQLERRRRSAEAEKSLEAGGNCGAPAINNTVTRVLRSINLENCPERVELQHSINRMDCSLANGQCENLFSRSSSGEYYVRGDRHGMRLEKATVEGSIIVSPFGSDHSRTITEQKLDLISVGKLPSSYPGCLQNTCVSDPSMLAKLSPAFTEHFFHAKPNQSRSDSSMWEMNGIGITEEERSGLKSQVVGLIHTAKSSILEANMSQVMMAGPNVDFALFLMMDFNSSEILDTISLIPPEEHDLVYGLLANIGSEPGVTAFLELVKAGEVSDIRELLFVATLNMNLKSPSVLRPLLDHIKGKNIDDHPFTTSQILVNFATLVSRVCVGPGNRTDTFVVLGREHCRQSLVLQDFQDFIIQKLSSTSEFWKQLVYVRTLVNLKTVEATNALLPYALGRRECDTHVRAVALEALASWNAPRTVQPAKVTLILLDLLENPAEHPTIRARALAFLASWPLSSTIWSRLALATKRPGLRDLSALTYSLIKTTSQHEHPEAISQRQFAEHALVFARPSSMEERLSSFKTWYRYSFKNQVGAMDYSMWIKNPASPFPHELSLYTRRAMASLTFHEKMDFMMSDNNGDLGQIASAFFNDKMPLPSGKNISSIFLNMMRNGLDIDEKVREAITGLVSFLPATAGEIFIPLHPKVTVDLLMSISGGDNILRGPGTFYFNPADSLFTYFSDLGLQVVTSSSWPSVYHFSGSVQFSTEGHHTYTVSSSDLIQVYTSAFRMNSWSLTPWSRDKVSSGISHSVFVTLPVSPNLVVRTEDSQEHNSGFELTLNLTQSDYKLFFMKMNFPSIVQGETGPASMEAMMSQSEMVRPAGLQDRPYQKSWFNPTSSLYLSYYGDSPLDLDFNALMEGDIDQLKKYVVAPNMAHFQLIGGQGVTSNLTFVLSAEKEHRERKSTAGRYVSKYGQDAFEESDLCDAPDGETSEASLDGAFSLFGNVSSPQLTSFLSKLQDNVGWTERVEGYSVRGEMWKYSDLVTSFEGVFATTTCYGLPDQKSGKTVFVLGMDDLKMCMAMNSTAPKVNELSVLGKIFGQNLTKAMHVEVWTGSACDMMIMSQNHTYSVSSEGLQKLKRDTEEAEQEIGEWQSDRLRAAHDGALFDKLQIVTQIADKKSWEKLATFFGTDVVALWDKLVKKVWKSETRLVPDPETGYTSQNLTALRNHDGTWRMMEDDRVTEEAGVFPELVDDWPKMGFQSFDFQPADYCIIRPDSIKTYDGFSLNVAADKNCSALATTLCEAGRTEDAFGVAVRDSGDSGVTATITKASDNFSISVGRDGIQVDNQTWDGEQNYFRELNSSSGEVYGRLYKRSGFYKVEILDLVEVIAMDSSVYIKAADRFRGSLCGLCGDLNLEPLNDMKTPEGCLLTDPAHFLSSWKPTSGFQCITEKYVDPSSCIREEPLGHDYYAQYTLE